MCVIPVYYIYAPGQNENEYSHMRALRHTQLILLKSINTDIVGITVSAHMLCAADDATFEQSLEDRGYKCLICT